MCVCKLELLKLLSHVLKTDLLIFVFKEKGTLSTAGLGEMGLGEMGGHPRATPLAIMGENKWVNIVTEDAICRRKNTFWSGGADLA